MPPQKKKARSDGPATPMPTQRTMMNFMWRFALCAAAVKEWSLGIVYEDSAAGDKATALGLLKKTLLGIAAFGCRCLGWQTPSPWSSTGTHAGMDQFALRRTRHADQYDDDADAPNMFRLTTDMMAPLGAATADDGKDGWQWRFRSSFWTVMYCLPIPCIFFCDKRGQRVAYSRFQKWQTADFVIRSMLYCVPEALKLLRIRVLDPSATGACYDDGTPFFGKPRLFVNTFSAGEPGGVGAMLAFEPEHPGSLNIHRNAAVKVMAEVYVRAGIAPKRSSIYATACAMRHLMGHFGAAFAVKNMSKNQSALQGLIEISEQLKLGGGAIKAALDADGNIKVDIRAAKIEKISELWPDVVEIVPPDADDEAKDEEDAAELDDGFDEEQPDADEAADGEDGARVVFDGDALELDAFADGAGLFDDAPADAAVSTAGSSAPASAPTSSGSADPAPAPATELTEPAASAPAPAAAMDVDAPGAPEPVSAPVSAPGPAPAQAGPVSDAAAANQAEPAPAPSDGAPPVTQELVAEAWDPLYVFMTCSDEQRKAAIDTLGKAISAGGHDGERKVYLELLRARSRIGRAAGEDKPANLAWLHNFFPPWEPHSPGYAKRAASARADVEAKFEAELAKAKAMSETVIVSMIDIHALRDDDDNVIVKSPTHNGLELLANLYEDQDRAKGMKRVRLGRAQKGLDFEKYHEVLPPRRSPSLI